jgi:hypothetical protein
MSSWKNIPEKTKFYVYKNTEMKSHVIIFNVFLHFCIISCGISIEFDNFYVEVR